MYKLTIVLLLPTVDLFVLRVFTCWFSFFPKVSFFLWLRVPFFASLSLIYDLFLSDSDYFYLWRFPFCYIYLSYLWLFLSLTSFSVFSFFYLSFFFFHHLRHPEVSSFLSFSLVWGILPANKTKDLKPQNMVVACLHPDRVPLDSLETEIFCPMKILIFWMTWLDFSSKKREKNTTELQITMVFHFGWNSLIHR